jgi:ProP effector
MSGFDSKPRDPQHAVLISLRSTFPVFQECRPLAIGIHKAVLERIPGINPQQLRLAMRMHTASARYLKALTHGETRFDLDGNAAGGVTPEQKQQALDTLRERFRKGAEQHKAQLLAQQQEQQRQEKFIRLAEKFNAQ